MLLARRRLLVASAAVSVSGLAARAGLAAAAPLRIAFLQGNPVQARVGADGRPHGPAIDLAEDIARRLGRPLEARAVAGTGPLADSLRTGAADLAFIAYDPSRAEGLRFTDPYLLSLNRFAVASGSPIAAADQVDRPGVRVGAVPTDTGGLYLRRTMKAATMVAVASADAGLAELKAGRIDVLGTAAQRLADLEAQGGFRVLPQPFYPVPQCIAVREGDAALLAVAAKAVAEARASGALAGSIARWRLAGAAAPSGGSTPGAAEAAKSLAPGGRLRVAINLGNNVLAQRSAAGELTGVSVVLARALAARLKVPADLIPFDAAGKVFAALDANGWDVAFLAVEPERATKVDFSPPYVYIESTYMVAKDSAWKTCAELDRPGVKIAVAKGAAYDLILSRTLKNAELVRAPTGAEAVDLFLAQKLDAIAGVRQFLDEKARDKPGTRVLPDAFSRIDQAMGVPKGREAGAAYIKAFLEEMKADGTVRKALDATGQPGAVVAPSA